MYELNELYEETILDHNRNPRNFLHRPADANRSAHGNNPVCGDEFTLYFTVRDGRVVDAGFEGVGCAISTASASLLSEQIKGRSEAEAEALIGDMQRMLTGRERDREAEARLGKLRILAGVRDYPMRVKCATLPWHVLHAALQGRDGSVSTEESTVSFR